jgi:hypothetical protein
MKFSSPLFVFSDVDLDYQYSLGYSRVTRVCLSIEFHLPDLPDKFPGGLKGVIPTGLQTAECPKDAGASSRLTSRPPHRATTLSTSWRGPESKLAGIEFPTHPASEAGFVAKSSFDDTSLDAFSKSKVIF